MISLEYHVVMGRRAQVNPQLMLRKARLVETNGYELITYDRVVGAYNQQRKDLTYFIRQVGAALERQRVRVSRDDRRIPHGPTRDDRGPRRSIRLHPGLACMVRTKWI